MKKWTDEDLRIAFEDGCKFTDLEDLKEYLKNRKQFTERQTPTEVSKADESEALRGI